MIFDRFEGVLFDESVVAVSGLVHSGEGPMDFLGSGFIIGPGLAVTARHVIEGFISIHYGEVLTIPHGYLMYPEKGRFRLCVWQGKENELLRYPFVVDMVSLSEFSDFAVLRLVPCFNMKDYIWRPYPLHALPMAVGSRTTAYGYEVRCKRVPMALRSITIPETTRWELLKHSTNFGEILVCFRFLVSRPTHATTEA